MFMFVPIARRIAMGLEMLVCSLQASAGWHLWDFSRILLHVPASLLGLALCYIEFCCVMWYRVVSCCAVCLCLSAALPVGQCLSRSRWRWRWRCDVGVKDPMDEEALRSCGAGEPEDEERFPSRLGATWQDTRALGRPDEAVRQRSQGCNTRYY